MTQVSVGLVVVRTAPCDNGGQADLCLHLQGYGWQNAHGVRLTNAGWGWDVAWRRCVGVLIGVTAAWIWGYLPPASSGKVKIVSQRTASTSPRRRWQGLIEMDLQRKSYARMVTTVGDCLCSILSQADERYPDKDEHARIESNILAMKKKLASFDAQHVALAFDVSYDLACGLCMD